jgi:hypothetical protein
MMDDESSLAWLFEHLHLRASILFSCGRETEKLGRHGAGAPGVNIVRAENTGAVEQSS